MIPQGIRFVKQKNGIYAKKQRFKAALSLTLTKMFYNMAAVNTAGQAFTSSIKKNLT
jgi:hypothetical protein